MITKEEYECTPAEEWKGVRVRSLRTLGNRKAQFPAGVVFTILKKDGGFEVAADRCPHCGLVVQFNRVHWTTFERVTA